MINTPKTEVEGLDVPAFYRASFRVEVSDERGQIVAITKDSLSGRDIGPLEKAIIYSAIAHLTGFVGGNERATAIDAALAVEGKKA